MYIIIAGSEGTGFTATNLEVFPKKENLSYRVNGVQTMRNEREILKN